MLAEYADWSALLGFYTDDDAKSILLGHGVEMNKEKERALLEEIGQARAYASSISGRLSVTPTVDRIPPGHEDYLNTLQATPIIDEVMKTGVSSWSFGLVELAKLHIYQPYINLEYAAHVTQRTPEPDDFAGVLKFCLPIRMDPTNQKVSVLFNPAQNTFSMVSENLDLRVLGTVQGEDDLKRKFVGFTYGFGLPQMFVVQYKSLLILKNGYHRAYSMLKKGHRSIPCIIVKTDNFALTGANRIGLFPAGIILSDRSPLMSDYFTRAAVTIPRRRARAILTVHAGTEIVQL